MTSRFMAEDMAVQPGVVCAQDTDSWGWLGKDRPQLGSPCVMVQAQSTVLSPQAGLALRQPVGPSPMSPCLWLRGHPAWSEIVPQGSWVFQSPSPG